jgi:hypothetical protein
MTIRVVMKPLANRSRRRHRVPATFRLGENPIARLFEIQAMDVVKSETMTPMVGPELIMILDTTMGMAILTRMIGIGTDGQSASEVDQYVGGSRRDDYSARLVANDYP